MKEWEKDFSDTFKETYWWSKVSETQDGIDDIKAFIFKEIKKAEERGFFTKLRTSGCYSRKETKTLVDKAREECARELIEWIEGEGTLMIDDDEVYYVTPNDIEQIKAKYIKE